MLPGVPPDYFSPTGQLWGNPIFRWDALRQTGYAWWLERIRHNLRLLDFLRIDHFRGFVAYWEVPATEKTAIHGQWVEAPANDFFAALLEKIPAHSLIAEDLGVITQEVVDVMNRVRISRDARFSSLPSMEIWLPIRFCLTITSSDCIAYTGTHDNNTLRGWFESEITAEEQAETLLLFGERTLLRRFAEGTHPAPHDVDR